MPRRKKATSATPKKTKKAPRKRGRPPKPETLLDREILQVVKHYDADRIASMAIAPSLTHFLNAHFHEDSTAWMPIVLAMKAYCAASGGRRGVLDPEEQTPPDTVAATFMQTLPEEYQTVELGIQSFTEPDKVIVDRDGEKLGQHEMREMRAAWVGRCWLYHALVTHGFVGRLGPGILPRAEHSIRVAVLVAFFAALKVGIEALGGADHKIYGGLLRQAEEYLSKEKRMFELVSGFYASPESDESSMFATFAALAYLEARWRCGGLLWVPHIRLCQYKDCQEPFFIWEWNKRGNKPQPQSFCDTHLEYAASVRQKRTDARRKLKS